MLHTSAFSLTRGVVPLRHLRHARAPPPDNIATLVNIYRTKLTVLLRA